MEADKRVHISSEDLDYFFKTTTQLRESFLKRCGHYVRVIKIQSSSWHSFWITQGRKDISMNVVNPHLKSFVDKHNNFDHVEFIGR